MRRRLKKEIDDLAHGIEPQRLEPLSCGTIPTTGGDTILRIPANGGDDRQLIREVCQKVAQAYIDTQLLPDAERRDAISRILAPLNTADPTEINPDHGKIFEFKTVA